ncbi:hypothetical protein M569_03487 [Genlisea aurea]|uniref:Uncharacterized protein n=1 Tax=Genlisea aurea TaxID=192259 RepID=S8D1Q4_9LAMI|nr:hypothetical protein M569_03487 [Genlisea aurea]
MYSDLKLGFRPPHRRTNNNHFIVLLGISVLVLGFGFALFGKPSNSFPQPDPPILGSVSFPTEQEKNECDLFDGNWIPHSDEPPYTHKSCGIIEDHQNCMKNGRPDTGYLYWRWKPRFCELDRVDPTSFLEAMRNKTWGFVGDSISRNHVQSFLCTLSRAEMAVEVYHDEAYKSRRWTFPTYNFTVSVIWTPFLAKASISEDDNGVSTSDIELHLDVLDPVWTLPYRNLDYVIISAGKWFVKTAIYLENGAVLGCHYCPKRNLTELGFNFAFRKVIRNVLRHVAGSRHGGTILYRTTTPDHFEGGEWFEGGSCKREKPSKEGELEMSEMNRILREIELEEFERASSAANEKGVDLVLFDVSPLSMLRPDGHPGAYRHFHPFENGKGNKVIYDCLHWCLPGPIDSWNDILFEMVMRKQ